MSKTPINARGPRAAKRRISTATEVAGGIVFTAVAVVLTHHFDLFEWFVRLTRAHENYQLDEMFVLFIAATAVLAVLAIRRSMALRGEVAAREASEARLSALFAASPYPVGLFSIDNGIVLDANVMALRGAGLRREEVVGRPLRDLPYWDPATADELVRQVREEGVVHNMEVALHTGAGVHRTVLVSAQTVELDGEWCFVAAMSDITDQRAAERARNASDAELRGVFSAMRDIVLVFSRDGQYLKVPATNADQLYRPAEEMLGKNVRDVLPAAKADAVRAVIQRALDERRPVTEEYMLHYGDRDVWLSAVVTPLDESSVVWVARDITDELEARRKLGESEAHYRLLFERNPQPMFVLDEETLRYLDVNDAALRHYGYTREEFLRMTAADLRPTDDVAQFHFAHSSDWPVDERRQFRHRKRNGDVIDVEIVRDFITYQGRPARLVLATDVTERLEVSRRFESAFGDAPNGMAIVGTDGRWRQVNAAMCELLGREASELVGKTSRWVTHPDDRELVPTGMKDLLSGRKRSAQIEKRYIHRSGRVVSAFTNATMVGTGPKAFIILHIVDITERRATEESLQRQALAFETMSEVVIVCDAGGRIIDVNPAAKTIFGFERDELIGKTPAIWQRQDGTPSSYVTISQALRDEGHWSGEYGYVAKDGRTGVVETMIKTLRDADGKTIAQIGVIRDVTERRQMQRRLLQSQKLEAIGSLAAGIAHEINTPVQYVGDNVRFLGDSVDAFGRLVLEARALAGAARAHSDLDRVVAAFEGAAVDVSVDYLMTELPLAARQARDGCERIAEIVHAMKGFAQPGGVEKQLVDLNVAVRDTVTVCRGEWKYDATLAMDLDATMPLVPCLSGELHQVVLNLIINAAQAIRELRSDSEELGRISVATRHDTEWAEIRVEDDGCGIPDAIRGKVFDPFFTTRAVGSGMGQGLSVSHATIVGKHEGTLTFESVEGRGTTFLVRLPLNGDRTVGAAA